MEHRQCKVCGKNWHSSERQKVWKCECGAEMTKKDEVEWKEEKTNE